MSKRIKPIQALLQDPSTVYTADDLRILWNIQSNSFYETIKYYLRTNQIVRLAKGIYTLNRNYNPLELAQKLQTPSYISLETALRQAGVIQQYSEELTCVGTYPRVYEVDGKTIRYHQMNQSLLSYPAGIQQTAVYNIATPERALVDSLYFGFQPDVERYKDWDTRMLRKLEKEYNVPRVTLGLQQYQLLP